MIGIQECSSLKGKLGLRKINSGSLNYPYFALHQQLKNDHEPSLKQCWYCRELSFLFGNILCKKQTFWICCKSSSVVQYLALKYFAGDNRTSLFTWKPKLNVGNKVGKVISSQSLSVMKCTGCLPSPGAIENISFPALDDCGPSKSVTVFSVHELSIVLSISSG